MADLNRAKNVLIVDDEVLIAMFLTDVVEDMSFEIVGTAGSGKEAELLAAERRPDIALVDFNLNGPTNGIQVSRHLVEAYGTAIIFLSGHGDLKDQPDIEQIAPIAILQKPCLPSSVEDALRMAEMTIDARQTLSTGAVRRSPG